MSTRSKKTTTTTTYTRGGGGGSTSAAATPLSSGGGGYAGAGSASAGRRSRSPAVISRVEEKNQLAQLNDRLANYIDRVRTLETENDRLSKLVVCTEETVQREVSKIKGLYEDELAQARRLLDQMGKEKARVQLELNKTKSDLEELQAKYLAKEKAASDLERKLLAAESQVNELQARLNDAVNQRRHAEDELNRLKKEFDAVNKQLVVAKKQLEDETIRRVDLENRIQSLKEELAFREQVHRQELDEMSRRTRVDIDAIDIRFKQDYDSRLADALRQMRAENDEQIQASRAEVEAIYQQKLADLQDSSNMWQDSAQRAQGELRQVNKRIEELTAEVNKLGSQASANASRVETLERMLQREREERQADVSVRDDEIRRLKAQLEEQLQEYRDLLDVKIQLDVEIAAYRKLLELEENRLNLSSETSPGSSRGPVRSTPLGDGSGGRKRRLVESHDSTTTTVTNVSTSRRDISSSEAEYVSVASGKNSIEVHEVDSDGKFVTLCNTSDKDVPLGAWSIKQSEGGKEVTYKFPRTVTLKSHQTLKVWSSEREHLSAHAPTDLTMKSGSWIAGESQKTTLIDSKGEEVACREMRRTVRTASPISDDSASDNLSRNSSWRLSSIFNILM